jgi:hypothetical protein
MVRFEGSRKLFEKVLFVNTLALREARRVGQADRTNRPRRSVACLEMPTKAITPRLADRLCSLAESQLQAQAARSAALDGGALGVMAVDAALAAIVIGTRGGYDLWIVALVLLALSLGVAVSVLRLPGTEQNGPLVVEILEARRTNDDSTIEEQLLDDLAHETLTNENALARKDPLMTSAVTCLIIGIVLELAAQVLQ